MRLADIEFVVSVIVHTLVPPVKQQVTPSGGGSTKRHLSVSDSGTGGGRSASVQSHHHHHHHQRRRVTASADLLQTVAFLGTRAVNQFIAIRVLGSRVVSVLDSGAEGPGFKSQPRRYRVTVLGKLFTPIVPLFTKQQNWLQPS